MSLVATLLVRDEADIIVECLTYYLNAGVDRIIVTDNNSTDGTRDLLTQFGNALHIIDEPGRDFDQSAWVTRMARLAYDLKADWIVNTDADEFWTGFQDLSWVPAEVSALKARRSYFHAPIRDAEFSGPVRQRMPYYVASDFIHPYLSTFERYDVGMKMLFRAEPQIIVTLGGLDVTNQRGRIQTSSAIAWHHYPIRSPEQFIRKTTNVARDWLQTIPHDLRVWKGADAPTALRKLYEMVSHPREELELLYKSDVLEIG